MVLLKSILTPITQINPHDYFVGGELSTYHRAIFKIIGHIICNDVYRVEIIKGNDYCTEGEIYNIHASKFRLGFYKKVTDFVQLGVL